MFIYSLNQFAIYKGLRWCISQFQLDTSCLLDNLDTEIRKTREYFFSAVCLTVTVKNSQCTTPEQFIKSSVLRITELSDFLLRKEIEDTFRTNTGIHNYLGWKKGLK